MNIDAIRESGNEKLNYMESEAFSDELSFSSCDVPTQSILSKIIIFHFDNRMLLDLLNSFNREYQ